MKETPPPLPAHDDQEEDEAVHVWDCGSPLYDSYELVSLSHVIDRHIMVLPSLSGSRQEIIRERSARFSHAPNLHLVIPPLFSSQNPSKAAASKKARGSGSWSWSWGVAVAFLSKLVERNAWKRRICGGGEREGKAKRPKKVKFSNGNCKVHNSVSSLRKYKYDR